MIATEIKEDIVQILQAGLAPMIQGSPGIGKSDIVKSISSEFKLELIDMRLSQCDPTDMLGFPTHNGERMGYAPPEHFPLAHDPLPKDKLGWLLFLDEFNSAAPSVQAAAYKLVLDRQVGKYSLHEKCAVVCAGNKETDGAIVNRMGTAMQSRLIHLELEVDAAAWIIWARANGIDHRVLSYIEGSPKHLHQFSPDHNDKTFACPRTWEFASKLIKGKDASAPRMLPLLCGTLSPGIAHGFAAYLKYCSDLPSIEDILARPDDIDIPDEPAMRFASSYMAAAYLNENNADRLMRYIARLPLEFGVVAGRAAMSRDKKLMKVDAVRAWAHEFAKEVF